MLVHVRGNGGEDVVVGGVGGHVVGHVGEEDRLCAVTCRGAIARAPPTPSPMPTIPGEMCKLSFNLISSAMHSCHASCIFVTLYDKNKSL